MTNERVKALATMAILDSLSQPASERNLLTAKRIAEAALRAVRHSEIRAALEGMCGLYAAGYASGSADPEQDMYEAYQRGLTALAEDPV